MLERTVEAEFKVLEGYGFLVLKLVTPAYNGPMDRIILAPKWSPATPVFVEVKAPGKIERPLQAAVRDNWRERGCDVRDMCDTPEKVKRLCADMLIAAVRRLPIDQQKCIPSHINAAFNRTIIWTYT